MKPSHTVDLTVQMPVADAMNTLAPQIDDLVNRRVAEIRERQDGGTRRLVIALDIAISNVSRAVVRFENSQHSKDEPAAIRNLIASAQGLRKAYTAYKKGL